MSILSFMTQSPMQYAQGMTQSSSTLPQWYNDYTQGILQNAAQFANQGYQPYPGQRIAGATPDQQASYGTVSGLQGYGTGVANQAIGDISGTLGGPNALTAGGGAIGGALAAPNALTAGGGAVNSALAGPNAYTAGRGAIGSALSGPNAYSAGRGAIGGALAGPTAYGAGRGAINSALAGPNALTAGGGDISGAVNKGIAGGMGQFMNPFLNDVVANNNMLSSRNFTENVLPALDDTFTRSGQVYGGSREGEYAERMARDLNLNQRISGAQTLAGGFNTAGQLAGQQEGLGIQGGAALGSLAGQAQGARIQGGMGLGSLAGQTEGAGIQGGAALGSLAGQAQGTGIQGGAALGSLAGQAQGTGIQGGAALGSLANQAQGTGIQGGSALGSLANQAQGTGIYGAGALGNLGALGQGLGLGQASAQNAMGTQQQQLAQANMNTGYNDFLQQQYWPLTASSAMQGALQGIQVPTGQTNYSYNPYTVGNSPLSNVTSTYGGLNSIFGQGGPLANLWNGSPTQPSQPSPGVNTTPMQIPQMPVFDPYQQVNNQAAWSGGGGMVP